MLVSFTATANINVKLRKSVKYGFGMVTTGVHRMAANAALLQCLMEQHQLNLKYCQVVAQVAHQVATMITASAGKVAIMAQEHCKNQYMVLQMARYTQCVLLAHQIVAAAVHVTRIVVMDVPVLLTALA
jgi:hypothetical protein